MWGGAPGSTLVVLCGEPGIGKTHLARAAVDDVEGALWVRFSSTERDGFVTWCAALDEAASDVPIGVLAALGPDVVSRVSGLLPLVAARLPTDPRPRAEDAGRDPTLDALAKVVEVVGRRRAIVLDDVQWAGPTSSAFVARLLATTSGLRMLATSRLPVPAEISRIATQAMPVGRLSDDHVASLLRDRGVADGDVTAITRRADGNPLLALFASGVTPESGGNPVADAFLTLPAEQLEVLGVAGLLGRTVDIVLLEQLTSRPGADLSLLLHAAVGNGLLDGHDPLSFVHDLVREAAEAALPVHRRGVLHAAAAMALKRRGDLLGAVDHVLQGFGALDADEAVETIVAGCEHLAERLAFEDLLVVATRLHSVVVADQRCRPRHEAAALLLAVVGLRTARRHPTAQERRRSRRGGSPRPAGPTCSWSRPRCPRAGYGLAGLADRDTLELLDAALAVVPDDDLARRARLTSMRAFYIVNSEGRGGEARATSSAALALARRGGDDEALAEVLAMRMFVLMGSSEVLEPVALADELRLLTPRLPPTRRRVAWASLHRNEGPLRLQLGDRAGFDELPRRRPHVRGGAQQLAAGVDRHDVGRPRRAARRRSRRRGAPRRVVGFGAPGRAQPRRQRSGDDRRGPPLAWHAPPIAPPASPLTPSPNHGCPLASCIAAVAHALAREDRARRRWTPCSPRVPILVDDSTLAAQLAAITEACVLTGTGRAGVARRRARPVLRDSCS